MVPKIDFASFQSHNTKNMLIGKKRPKIQLYAPSKSLNLPTPKFTRFETMKIIRTFEPSATVSKLWEFGRIQHII